jgi:hypothetical protein
MLDRKQILKINLVLFAYIPDVENRPYVGCLHHPIRIKKGSPSTCSESHIEARQNEIS